MRRSSMNYKYEDNKDEEFCVVNMRNKWEINNEKSK